MVQASTRGGLDRESQLLDLIGRLYDAALAPEGLPQVFSQLTELCGAMWTLTSVVPLSGGKALSLQNAEADPERLALFNSKYVTPDLNPAMLLLLASRPGEILLREQFYSDRVWEHFDMYQEIYRPIGVGASLGTVLLRSQQHFVPLGMMRSKSRGAYEPEMLATLSRVLPHLTRVIQILLRLNDLEARARSDEALWNRLPYGVVLLEDNGRILWSNSAADAIISRSDGLTARGGMLQAKGAEDNAALLKLIGEAAETATGRGIEAGGALAVPRDARRPLAVLVAPFSIDRTLHNMPVHRPAVVVLINDPDCHPQPPAEMLAKLYRFTRRETALACLLIQGLDLREAADRLDVGMSTVRTHLRQIFEKTGTRRQAQLVSLLLRSVAVLRTEPDGSS